MDLVNNERSYFCPLLNEQDSSNQKKLWKKLSFGQVFRTAFLKKIYSLTYW